MSVEQGDITEIYCRSCNRPLYSWDREGLCSVCYRLKWSKIETKNICKKILDDVVECGASQEKENKMEKYKLLKDLPNAKAGEIFEYASGKTQQLFSETSPATFSAQEIKEYDILNPDKGWFEEMKEDGYWYIEDDGVLAHIEQPDFIKTACRKEIGNYFSSQEEAEKEFARRKAYVILKEDTKGFEPDWGNPCTDEYYVYYAHDRKHLGVDYRFCYQSGLIYFATRADAEASIKAHEKEWRAWLGVKE